jgi:hypothetical protein
MIDLIEGTDEPPLRDTQVDKLPIGDRPVPACPTGGRDVGQGKETEWNSLVLPLHCTHSGRHPYLLVSH